MLFSFWSTFILKMVISSLSYKEVIWLFDFSVLSFTFLHIRGCSSNVRTSSACRGTGFHPLFLHLLKTNFWKILVSSSFDLFNILHVYGIDFLITCFHENDIARLDFCLMVCLHLTSLMYCMSMKWYLHLLTTRFHENRFFIS